MACVPSEDSDQSRWMPMLIWAFACTQSFCWFWGGSVILMALLINSCVFRLLRYKSQDQKSRSLCLSRNICGPNPNEKQVFKKWNSKTNTLLIPSDMFSILGFPVFRLFYYCYFNVVYIQHLCLVQWKMGKHWKQNTNHKRALLFHMKCKPWTT